MSTNKKHNNDKNIKLFISYSRNDSAIADNIADLLEGINCEVLIDRRALPFGEEWKQQLERFILDSDIVIWLVSKNSLNSHWCLWELGLASDSRKKIIPVIISEVDHAQLPDQLGSRHALPIEGIFSENLHLNQLANAINTDIDWVIQHSKFNDRARDWEANRRTNARLLRGGALFEAEKWLNDTPVTAPAPNGKVSEFILHSELRRSSLRRRAIGALIMTILFLVIGWTLFEREKNRADQEHLRAQNEQNLKLHAESYSIAQTVEKAVDTESEIADALKQAINSLPDLKRGRMRPYVAKAEAAAMKAYHAVKLEATLTGHQYQITHLAASPSYRYVASGSIDKTIRIWSVKRKALHKVLQGHTDFVLFVLFSRDGKILFSASDNGTIRVWSVNTGREIKKLEAHTGPVTRLVLSPDGSKMISASVDGTARLWNLADYTSSLIPHIKPDWTPQKNEKGFFLHRQKTSDGSFSSVFYHLRRTFGFAYIGLGVTDVEFAPDGKSFLTSGEDGRVVSWTDSGAMLFELNIDSDPVYQIEVDFDRGRLYAATKRYGEIWNLKTRQKITGLGQTAVERPIVNYWPIIYLALSPDKTLLYSSISGPQTAVGSNLWDARTGRLLGYVARDKSYWLQSADMARTKNIIIDGNGHIEKPGLIIRRGDGPSRHWIRLIRLASPDKVVSVLKGHQSAVSVVRFARGVTRIISGDFSGTVKLWNLEPREHIDTLTHGPSPGQTIAIASITSDGQKIATVNGAGLGRLWVGRGPERKGVWLSRTMVKVANVGPGSASDKAGIKPGDLIREIDGQRIFLMKDIQRLVQPAAGTSLKFVIERKGHRQTLTITPMIKVAVVNGKQKNTGLIGISGSDRPDDDFRLSQAIFSDDGRKLVTGSITGRVLIWDIDRIVKEGKAYQPVYLDGHQMRLIQREILTS